MDTHVKEGQLYVQHQKFGKKWKKNWFVLYPASQNGIARLEFYDAPSGGGGGGGGGSASGTNEKTRKLDKKIIRLSECISILPALTESCPKENMAAFCVETNDKNHVFAAEKNAAKDWMDTMCDIAFQGGSGSSSSTAADSNGGLQDMQMSENLIYYSREEVNEFWVNIQRTEASERCGLAGSYWLKAESDILILKEPKTKRKILVWPYKLLRRYGRDRVMFSFEAGRRCDSGPGNFTFETKQGNEIFMLVDQAIQSQKALAEDHHLNSDPECPPSLLYIRNAGAITGSGDSSSSSSREADGDSGGSKPGSADGVLGKREVGDGGGGGGGRGQGSGAAGGLKGRCLPEPPAMLGVLAGGATPPRSPRGQAAAKGQSSADEHAHLYSEPADSVRLPLYTADCLYSDPVDSIKGQNQTSNSSNPPVPTPRLRPVGDEASAGGVQGDQPNHRKPPDLYSHVYDQINMELNQKTSVLSLNGGGRGVKSKKRPPGGQAEGVSLALLPDHIYDEPEGCASLPATLGMTIYSESRLEPHSQRKQEEAVALSGSEGYLNTAAQAKSPEPHRLSPPQLGPRRGTQHPPAPKGRKPLTAPKPGRDMFGRKEPVPLPPGKPGAPGSNVNNNNNNIWGGNGEAEGRELYSKVSKQKRLPANSWYSQHHQAPLRSPDIIYDNLGDI
ncbi:docking protein 1 [Solea senegalensis]|uniref:Docking protein 1 n=1 Tax=Solea senegalensis TaxID=28829 RepID=A0AAV6QT58_SOLSE|nr:docking protein 1b [Solea senegalensis]KAG7495940.1 docking protein 1 [Solea senegalensis]